MMRVKLYRGSIEDISNSHVPDLYLRLMCLIVLTIIVSSQFSIMLYVISLMSLSVSV
jgi:hypothetical protein